MLAAILNKQNENLILDDVEAFALDVGQVLVKVEASSICGRQIAEITGRKGEDHYLPHLLGHEGCGVVEDIGLGVTTVKTGDKVVMHWRKGEGIESTFPRYKWGSQIIGGGLLTTLSEKSVVAENRITKIPDDIPADVASLLGCATTTGLGLVNNEADLKIGQSIVVIGAGGVGLNVIQAAKLVSANPIIAVDIHKDKLAKALDMGATAVIDNSITNIREALDNLNLKKIDVVVETVGFPALIEIAYSIASAGGKLILVGQPDFRQSLTIEGFSNNIKGLTVKDSEGGLTQPSVDIPRYINLYQSGVLKLHELITNTYSLKNINEAISDMKDGKVVGKCIIKM
jgi:S-(hydroxymethyl)glutathione dehydrogenase/alcohol dehydrogenase